MQLLVQLVATATVSASAGKNTISCSIPHPKDNRSVIRHHCLLLAATVVWPHGTSMCWGLLSQPETSMGSTQCTQGTAKYSYDQ